MGCRLYNHSHSFSCLHLRDQLATLHLPDIEVPAKATHSEAPILGEEKLGRLLGPHLNVLHPVGQPDLLLASVACGHYGEAEGGGGDQEAGRDQKGDVLDSPLVTYEAEHEHWLRLVDAFGQFPTSSGQRVLADVVAGKVLREWVLDRCKNHLTAEEELA